MSVGLTELKAEVPDSPAPEQHSVAARPNGPPTAVWGMWILIASEGMLFAAFIGTYYYLRFHTAAWPPPGVSEPRVVVPIALAVILALTSIPVHLASQAAQARNVRRAWLLLFAALIVQTGYFAYQVHDFDGSTVGHNAYTSIYDLLLGGAHAHVFLGLLFSVWLLVRLAGGLTAYRVNATRAIAWYWHFVNVLTLVVTAVLLSAHI